MVSSSFFIEVLNKTDFFVDEKRITDILGKVFTSENRKKFLSRNISVVLLGGEEMRELNKKYRKKDYIADVLSFLYNERDILGEIIICPQQIIELSGEKKEENQKKEIYRTIIHGALHLLGYIHNNDKEEKIMKKKTEQYLEELK